MCVYVDWNRATDRHLDHKSTSLRLNIGPAVQYKYINGESQPLKEMRIGEIRII